MKILLLSATVFEIEPTVNKLRARAESESGNVLTFSNGVTIEVLFTGVGLTATAYALGHRFGGGQLPGLAIQAGVGGAIDRKIPLGQVVRISRETFGDLGAEEQDGRLLNLSDIGLHPGPPFDKSGVLRAPAGLASLPFPECAGLSVNQVSGTAETIARRRERFPEAQVESMEGAAFFYACLQSGIEPLQLRAISNYVEPRNRDNWRMGEAISSLNEALWRVVGAFL
ncbi:futalosine hydrolase [Neolewinella agarilytica]|uniref:Futalosine hydrolase n=1 Tax=Neolewinella agarilytica TaxID=478744 RepID=A0A1H8ZCS1_9BACT|nr:futalosine hydrolase [Neolewinella agarilytica]SEP62195.1 futalosine hydrolase [Neolewinella agarilytica]